MEIHREELKIIDLFRKDILAELTLKQIMGQLNKNSYNWTYKAVKKLSKGILALTKVGNTEQAKLDLDSPLAITYLAYLDRKESCEKDIPLANELIEKISKKTPYFILLVAGSYAAGTAGKSSDIDVVIIVEDKQKKKEIMPYVKDVARLSAVSVDEHIFARQEFYLMLVSDTENFGKEVLRKHLLFYGAEPYYQIIREAVRNGLQNRMQTKSRLMSQ